VARTREAADVVRGDTDQVDFSWFTNWARRRNGPVARRLRAAAESDTALLAIGGPVLAVAIAVWLTWGAWGPRPPAGEDTLGHLVLTRFAVSSIFGHFHLDGWQPRFILGFQQFLFYPPGLSLLVAALHAATLGLLSVDGAFKLVFVGSFVVSPLAVAFCARSFGLSHRAAGIAAILVLCVNSAFGGVGLQGLFGVGLVLQQVGALFFFVALGSALRLVAEPRTRWFTLTAQSFGGLVIVHGRSAAVLGVMLALILLLVLLRQALAGLDDQWQARAPERVAMIVKTEVRRELSALGLIPKEKAPGPEEAALTPQPRVDVELSQRTLRPLVAALAVGLGLGAFYVLPFWAHRNLQGALTGWGTPPIGRRLHDIWRGDFLYRPKIALVVLVGWVYGLFRVARRRDWALALVAMPIVFLVIGHWSVRHWPNSLVAAQLPERGIGFAGAIALFPVAALLARAARLLGRFGDLLALVAAAGLVLVPLGLWRDVAKQMPDPIPQLRAAAVELSKVVPEGARFATERDYPAEITTTKVVDPDRWLAWASGRNTLDIFSTESTPSGDAGSEPERFKTKPPEEVADALSRFGVTHAVVTSATVTQRFGASSRFVREWNDGPITIFKVVAPSGQPDPASQLSADGPVSARLTRGSPEHLAIDVDADRTTAARVALTWSPKWHASLDGRAVPIRPVQQGLVGLTIPAGPHHLVLNFGRDLWDSVGVLVSLATAAGLLVFVRADRVARRGRRIARRPPEPNAGREPVSPD
jgi:hypothetical protein